MSKVFKASVMLYLIVLLGLLGYVSVQQGDKIKVLDRQAQAAKESQLALISQNKLMQKEIVELKQRVEKKEVTND